MQYYIVIYKKTLMSGIILLNRDKRVSNEEFRYQQRYILMRYYKGGRPLAFTIKFMIIFAILGS